MGTQPKKDRLAVCVVGHQKSGKSKTWNTLFGKRVRTSGEVRHLPLGGGECAEVFLVSGSPEERNTYVAEIIGKQNARIVLCSVQYVEHGRQTFDYFLKQGYTLYVHWLNPGYMDRCVIEDHMGLMDCLLYTRRAFVAIRSGKHDPRQRVQELREYIYGWAAYRDLVFECKQDAK
jgi:hypothetical protein